MSVLRQSLLLLVLFGLAVSPSRAYAVSSTLFDWNPLAVGLHGLPLIADTLKLSDYGQINIDPTTGAFTETGYLPILGFQLNGRDINPIGFNSQTGLGWGAYISYQGVGVEIYTASGITIDYTSLTYSLYGFNGLASYGLDANGIAYESGGKNLTLLADGGLIDGSLTLVPTAFDNGVPIQFYVNGTIDGTINDVPRGFSTDIFQSIDLNVVHLPGELFPVSATTLEANGGSSSTATLTQKRRRFGFLAKFLPEDEWPAANQILAVTEPGTISILAIGVVSGGLLFRRRGKPPCLYEA